MINRLSSKNGKKGFSLSETLITILLLSIIMSGIISGIIAVRNSYEKFVLRADALTLIAAIAEGMEGDLSTASEPVIEYTDAAKTIVKKDNNITNNEIMTFNSGLRGYNMSFVNHEGSICVQTPELSDPFGVTTKGEHTTKLNSKLTDFHYDTAGHFFSYNIVIETAEIVPSEVLSQQYVIRRYS